MLAGLICMKCFLKAVSSATSSASSNSSTSHSRLMSPKTPGYLSNGELLPSFIKCRRYCHHQSGCHALSNGSAPPSYQLPLQYLNGSSNTPSIKAFIMSLLSLLRQPNCAEQCYQECVTAVTEYLIELKQERLAEQSMYDANVMVAVKYNGRWPFRMIMGASEFASLFFSLVNLAIHIQGYLSMKKSIRAYDKQVHTTYRASQHKTSHDTSVHKAYGTSVHKASPESYHIPMSAESHPLQVWYDGLCWIGSIAWIASSLFHYRDNWSTEWLDYVMAAIAVVYSTILSFTRMMQWYSRKAQLTMLSVMVVYIWWHISRWIGMPQISKGKMDHSSGSLQLKSAIRYGENARMLAVFAILQQMFWLVIAWRERGRPSLKTVQKQARINEVCKSNGYKEIRESRAFSESNEYKALGESSASVYRESNESNELYDMEREGLLKHKTATASSLQWQHSKWISSFSLKICSFVLCFAMAVWMAGARDYGPIAWGTLDSHALWHAATIPMVPLWYSTFMEDSLWYHQQQVRYKA